MTTLMSTPLDSAERSHLPDKQPVIYLWQSSDSMDDKNVPEYAISEAHDAPPEGDWRLLGEIKGEAFTNEMGEQLAWLTGGEPMQLWEVAKGHLYRTLVA